MNCATTCLRGGDGVFTLLDTYPLCRGYRQLVFYRFRSSLVPSSRCDYTLALDIGTGGSLDFVRGRPKEARTSQGTLPAAVIEYGSLFIRTRKWGVSYRKLQTGTPNSQHETFAMSRWPCIPAPPYLPIIEFPFLLFPAPCFRRRIPYECWPGPGNRTDGRCGSESNGSHGQSVFASRADRNGPLCRTVRATCSSFRRRLGFGCASDVHVRLLIPSRF